MRRQRQKQLYKQHKKAYNNALTARDTARTNYLAADNSALAKAVITTQQALEAENAKVEAATVKYNKKNKRC